MLGVDIEPLGLQVWAIGSADIRAFVPIQAQPFQVANDLFSTFRDVAVLIGVFYAEDEFPAGPANDQPAEKGCASPTDV